MMGVLCLLCVSHEGTYYLVYIDRLQVLVTIAWAVTVVVDSCCHKQNMALFNTYRYHSCYFYRWYYCYQ